MSACGGNGGRVSLILNLGTLWGLSPSPPLSRGGTKAPIEWESALAHIAGLDVYGKTNKTSSVRMT